MGKAKETRSEETARPSSTPVWTLATIIVAAAFACAFNSLFSFKTSTDIELDICPGYRVSNVVITSTGLAADLEIAGPKCNVFGLDIDQLRLSVNYDTESRLHVQIEDAAQLAYRVPHENFPRPSSSRSVAPGSSLLDFTYDAGSFSFKVIRKSNKQILFDSSAASLVFEHEYIRLRTALPKDPKIYGLGEHADSFRLPTTDYTRTLWSRDSYGIPSHSNLYGNHPVYFDNRGSDGTHGVFLLTSVGMDVKVNNTSGDDQYLEYNLLGGVLDLYFVAGPSPIEVAQQYSDIVGKAGMMPYWSFGLHQCRYGYRDFYAIAEVVYNYSAHRIPLETMWTDIDYMYERYIMTTDPDRFPVARVREYIDYLHDHDQKYIVMVDPAIAYETKRDLDQPYETFLQARDLGLFMQRDSTIYQGVVWPGVSGYPDWFHPRIQQFWQDEFIRFFSADSGIDIDGLWIDMNEAANFNYFGSNAHETAIERGFPPTRQELRSSPRHIPGFPKSFQPNSSSPLPPDDLSFALPWLAPDAAPNMRRSTGSEASVKSHRAEIQVPLSSKGMIGYPGRNLLAPPYQIANENSLEHFGGLSNFSLHTDLVHYDGHVELDVHNLYGSMMSKASRAAMEARRPGRRPLVVTRSTFAGDGRTIAKWLGDNLSTWEQYRNSIQGMLNFAAIFQMPMVGSDVCGFGFNTTETLCARWATLGAFNPFYRNHNGDSSIAQEFYMWDSVATAARYAIDIRYRLLDYIYTALYRQSRSGKPLLNPLYFMFPNDSNTFDLELQFFYGDSLLISPVTEENATSVDIYLPKDLFYDFKTFLPVEGKGSVMTLHHIPFTEIPIHIKSGSIIPLRTTSGMTTTEVRKEPFRVLIAPNLSGRASGSLYLDDGDSIIQESISDIKFEYEKQILKVDGVFDYLREKNTVRMITILGIGKKLMSAPEIMVGNGDWVKIDEKDWIYREESQSVDVEVDVLLDGQFSLRI